MDEGESLFRKIVDDLLAKNVDVTVGRMMSEPGIKYKNRVFAFYHGSEMVFRLGKDFDPKTCQIKTYSLLNPFKSKPPLSGWFQIPYSESAKWKELADRALRKMIDEHEHMK